MKTMEEMRICWIIELAGWFQLADFSSGGGKNFGLLSFTETLWIVLFSWLSSDDLEGSASTTGAVKERLSSTKHIRNDSVE